MKKEFENYKNNNLVSFSIRIEQKFNKNLNKWKKDIKFPKDWQNYTLEKNYFNDNFNGIALLTGKINNIIVIDIDNLEHWKMFLEEHNKKEPDTIKARSGSGGLHLYFKYSDDFHNIKSNSKCFGPDYDIDIRTNGGCIIAPPTKYNNNNLNKEVEYTWEKNIFENKIISLPSWIKKLLDKNQDKKNKKIENKDNGYNGDNVENENQFQNIVLNQEDTEIDFNSDDIEILINLLSNNRCENYNDWVSVGMCLFNLSKNYLYIWRKWSQKSEKYENGSCESKWNSFKKHKEGLKIGSLLLWARNDSQLEYDTFIKKKKLNTMIVSKYPTDKLILGDTVLVNDKCNYTNLNNKECLIKGSEHADMPKSMYVEVLDKFMTIKCRHPECFGKTYPCNHILMNKNEMNIAFNGDITININNTDDELIEFQKIDIFEDENLNEMVYNSLNGEHAQLAEIIYYYYKDNYNYGEDNNWYMYENHKWQNIGNKNMDLRHNIQPNLKNLYTKLIKYYIDNDYDKNKLKALKNIMKTFGDSSQKNNIMNELVELFFVNNNKDKDFTKKLDNNNYLLGFNNGVYDLKKFVFREGKPNDFISLSTGYDYQEKHTEKYGDLLKFFEDIQPNKEERDYMLTYLSIGLVGNLLELFTILTGCGRNGKSKLIELLKFTLGDYFGSVQSQLFTRPRPDANSPDPGLLSLLKRILVF